MPDWLAARFDGLDDDPATRKLIAAAIAAEQVLDLVDRGVTDFHFYTMNRADLVYAICHLLGLRPAVEGSRVMSVDKTLREEAAKRILVLDGAMGTMIQEYKLDEAGYRGARFDAWNREVRGNNDLLNLSQPKAVRDIHLAYFRAGADIVSTNTFSSTSIAQADYGMQDIAYELNFEGARLVRAAAITAENEDGRKRFVAGAHRADQPHGVDLAGRVQSGLPRHHLRSVARGLRRAGARPARRRRGPAADRDDLRHAQRQGGDPRDPRRDRGARRRACRS